MDKLENSKQSHSTLDAARSYVRQGFKVVPIPFQRKSPMLSGWQNLEISEGDLPKYFNGKPQNIGILLGDKSGGLVDVDLDSPEAVILADWFLPKTGAIFGRRSKPSSHWLYFSPESKFQKFNDPIASEKREDRQKTACIVEIRTNQGEKGIQTVFPPSVHESGEPIEWVKSEKPAQVSADILKRAVGKLASASLLAKHWCQGIRQDFALAISGALLRHDFPIYEVKHFINAICTVTNDEEIAKRLQAVNDTAKKIANGQQTYGLPKLAKLTDGKIVSVVCEWLEIEQKNNTLQKPENSPNVQGKNRFTFASLDELLDEPEEKHSFVWDETLILGGLSVCSAKPKVGKSTFARNLAVAISRGIDFLGRSTIKGKIIYLCLEEKRAEIARLFKKMEASGADIFIHTGKSPNDFIEALKYAVAEIEPVLVVVDPMSRALRVADFNDYATMSRGLEPFVDLAREFGTHILMLHHEGKGGREGNDSILGSTAIFGAVDCHLSMKKRDFGRTIASTQRYGKDLPETVIQLDSETGLVIEKGDLESFVFEETKTKILAVFAEGEQLSETQIKECVAGGSKGQVSKAIRSLVEQGKLNRIGDGKRNAPYLYFIKKQVTDDFNREFDDTAKTPLKAEEKKESSDSGLLGYPNNENPENPENPVSSEPEKDYYECPNCKAKVPFQDNVCPSCNKKTFDF